MTAEVWASLGTIAATLLLVVIPGLVHAWYVLEYLIGDEHSYARVMAAVDGTSSSAQD